MIQQSDAVQLAAESLGKIEAVIREAAPSVWGYGVKYHASAGLAQATLCGAGVGVACAIYALVWRATRDAAAETGAYSSVTDAWLVRVLAGIGVAATIIVFAMASTDGALDVLNPEWATIKALLP